MFFEEDEPDCRYNDLILLEEMCSEEDEPDCCYNDLILLEEMRD